MTMTVRWRRTQRANWSSGWREKILAVASSQAISTTTHRRPQVGAEAGGIQATSSVKTRAECSTLLIERRRSGENVAATEVETVLCAHPAVKQIAVLAVPDEKTGEEILACIVPAPDRTVNDKLALSIFDYCNEQLAYYKAPGWVLFLDRMPVTPTQKVSKTQIFASGEDPRALPGVIDLRAMKKRR